MILQNKPAIIAIFIVVILTASHIPASGFLRKTPKIFPGLVAFSPQRKHGIPSRNGKAWWKNFPTFSPFSKAPNRGTSFFGSMWDCHPKWLTVSRGSPWGPISASSAGVSFVTTWCGPCAHGTRDAAAVGKTQCLMEGRKVTFPLKAAENTRWFNSWPVYLLNGGRWTFEGGRLYNHPKGRSRIESPGTGDFFKIQFMFWDAS